MTRPVSARAVALALALAWGTATCARGSMPGAGAPASPTPGSPGGTVTVFAAASLQEAFTTLGKRFQAAHPRARVVFNFGPSSGLAENITRGAPADVFASASPTTMDTVVRVGVASDPRPFAVNAMEIAVPPTNPGQVSGVEDLADPAVTVALCQPQVPCGATAARVLANAKLTVRPVTEEADVKAVLTKVELDEVDAGLVYATDVRAAGAKVRGIPIPTAVNASTTYPIATLTTATNPSGGSAFAAYVLSPEAAAVLTAAGFAAP